MLHSWCSPKSCYIFIDTESLWYNWQVPTNYGKLWSHVYLQEICKCILNPSHTLRNGHSLSEFQQMFTHFGSFFSVSRLQKKIGKKIFELKMYTDTKQIFYDMNGWLSRINLDYRNACDHILWSSFYAQAPEILKCIFNGRKNWELLKIVVVMCTKSRSSWILTRAFPPLQQKFWEILNIFHSSHL